MCVWPLFVRASLLIQSKRFEIICSPLQILPDVPRLSVLSRGKVSRAPGGGGAQTGSGGALQTGPTPQPADLLSTHCSPGQPQQVIGKLQVWRYICSFRVMHPTSFWVAYWKMCALHYDSDRLTLPWKCKESGMKDGCIWWNRKDFIICIMCWPSLSSSACCLGMWRSIVRPTPRR